MTQREVSNQEEGELTMMHMAIHSVGIAIEHIDIFGRNAPFKWPNGRDVILFEEHKEVMKILLYWKREVEIYKELYMEDKKDDATG